MNPFQLTFNERLTSWRDLRQSVNTQALEQSCIAVDSWWQQAPLVAHHLHWQDLSNWSDPWTILSENTYCTLTRALGMCYTFVMNNIDVELVLARDDVAEEHYLVLVDGAKYICNYWPNSVLSTTLSNFNVISSKDLESIKAKIK